MACCCKSISLHLPTMLMTCFWHHKKYNEMRRSKNGKEMQAACWSFGPVDHSPFGPKRENRETFRAQNNQSAIEKTLELLPLQRGNPHTYTHTRAAHPKQCVLFIETREAPTQRVYIHPFLSPTGARLDYSTPKIDPNRVGLRSFAAAVILPTWSDAARCRASAAAGPCAQQGYG